jgi:hypothetical protein
MIKKFRFQIKDFFQNIPQEITDQVPTNKWQSFLWFLIKYYRYFFIVLIITSFLSLTEQILINTLTEQFASLFEHNPSFENFKIFLIKTGLFLILYIFLEICARFRDFTMAYTIPMFEGNNRIILKNSANIFTSDLLESSFLNHAHRKTRP